MRRQAWAGWPREGEEKPWGVGGSLGGPRGGAPATAPFQHMGHRLPGPQCLLPADPSPPREPKWGGLGWGFPRAQTQDGLLRA